MGNYDLSDRLNWEQACTLLGCSKSTLYRLIRLSKIKSYGAANRNRWFSRSNLQEYMQKKSEGVVE